MPYLGDLILELFEGADDKGDDQLDVLDDGIQKLVLVVTEGVKNAGVHLNQSHSYR
jgi:hypothetical protein